MDYLLISLLLIMGILDAYLAFTQSNKICCVLKGIASILWFLLGGMGIVALL